MTSLLRSSRSKTTPRLIILLFLATFAYLCSIHIREHSNQLTLQQSYVLSSTHTNFPAKLQELLHNEKIYGPVTANVNQILASVLLDNNFTVTENNSTMQRKWYRYLSTELDIAEKQFKPYMKPSDKQILYETLSKLRDICQSLQFTCIMYGGTLLGSWRHHDIIPWDGDADVMTNSTEKDELFSALAMLSPSYEVFNSGTRFKFYSRKATQTTEYPWKWPYVDIWFFNENKTHIWDEVPSRAFMREYVYPKNVIFPTHSRPLGKITFNAPYDSFAVLKITYKTTDCETYFYNHKYEKSQRHMFKSLPCYIFRNVVGFVYRVKTTDGLLEMLIQGSNVVHVNIVKEPVYAIADPFNLTLLEK